MVVYLGSKATEKEKKKSGLSLDPLESRSWRPGEVRGVCAKERNKQ